MLNERIITANIATPAKQRRNGEIIWSIPVYHWGPPGVGKTEMMEDIAYRAGVELFIPIVPSNREPADIAGLPIPEEHFFTYKAPKWAYEANEAASALIFLDECGDATPAMQAALQRVINERYVGDLKLKGSVRILGAGNPVGISTNGYDMSGPVANRGGHVDLNWGDHNVDRWCEWLLTGGVAKDVRANLKKEEVRVMEEWPKAFAEARGLWAGFVRKNRDKLFNMPDRSNPNLSRAWSSPRTTEMAVRATASGVVHHLTEVEADAFIAYFVGEGTTAEFAAYKSKFDLPDVDLLLSGKERWEHDPSRPDRTNAVLESCTARLSDEKLPHRIEWAARLWEIITPLTKTDADLAVMAGRSLCAMDLTGKASRDALNNLRPALIAAGTIGG